jgi:type I restriction enzyme, S subunit
VIQDLKPYPAMKDSGVPWLGTVPTHWDVEPVSRIGQLFKGRGGNKGDEATSGVPCVRYGDLYTRHEFFVNSTKACVSPERALSYTRIRYGDVLFAASGETFEDIGRSAVNLLAVEAVCGGDVILLRPTRALNPRFLGYAADAPSSRNQKATMGRGFTVVHIYTSELKRLALAIPPLAEQAAIVRFLDHADRRIRRYIRAKQKLITLLEEQKQAIVHRVVTRGLDPNVRLKPSGVEWLGDVPEHWDVRPAKYFASSAESVGR